MEDFTPEKGYRPEDEYESLEDEAIKQEQEAPIPPKASEKSAAAQPAEQPQQPMQQPIYGAFQQTPVYPTVQQPAMFTQPIQQYPTQQYPVQQPVQQYPVQQTVMTGYPSTVYQPINAMQYPQTGVQPAAVVTQPTQTQPAQPAVQATPYPRSAPVATPPLSPNPYAQGYSEMPQEKRQPNPPTSTGTKVFLIVLCALLAAMIIGFIVYISASANNNNNYNSGLPIPDSNGATEDYAVPDYYGNNIGSNYTDIDAEITLKADNGDTQKRDDDNPDSVGKPDENAKNITLDPLPEDKDDEKYTTQSAYDSVCDSVVTVECYKDKITDNTSDIVSQGTGTIISTDGYLITNAHVIGNSRVYAVNVVMNTGDEYQAKIVGYDTWTDLAVLKIDAKDLKAVTFGDSSLINIGDDVIAIGSPGGEKFQNSLTKGIVSAVDRELSINRYVRYIQSDAAISPGNSGGPLCNIYGQVIGITTVKTVATYYENMSFSIPSATVEEIVGDLMRYGYVKGRCRIGITGSEVTQEESLYYGAPAGVLINSIDKTGSLAGTDIKEGDIITEIDGQQVTTFQDIYDVLADHQPGDKVDIKVSRAEQ